jgi:hypothetical protein
MDSELMCNLCPLVAGRWDVESLPGERSFLGGKQWVSRQLRFLGAEVSCFPDPGTSYPTWALNFMLELLPDQQIHLECKVAFIS